MTDWTVGISLMAREAGPVWCAGPALSLALPRVGNRLGTHSC